MCGDDPSDSRLVRSVRCTCICQLVIEVIYALLCVTTVRDMGYAGLPAAALGICGTLVVLMR